MLLSIFFIFHFVNRAKYKEHPIKKQSILGVQYSKAILLVFASNFVLTLLDYLFQYITGHSLQPQMQMETTSNPLFLFLTLAVFPAFAEEYMFRYVLYRYLRRYGIVFAAITSSMLFGFLHMNFLQLVFAACMGIVLCYVYEKTGTIVSAIFIHMLNNSISILFCMEGVSEQIKVAIQCGIGMVCLIALLYYVVKNWDSILKNIKEQKQEIHKCLYFFTSVPMMILTIICITVCVFMLLETKGISKV